MINNKSLSKLYLGHMLFVAFKNHLIQLCLDVWPLILTALLELFKICWFPGRERAFSHSPSIFNMIKVRVLPFCFINLENIFNVCLGNFSHWNTKLCQGWRHTFFFINLFNVCNAPMSQHGLTTTMLDRWYELCLHCQVNYKYTSHHCGQITQILFWLAMKPSINYTLMCWMSLYDWPFHLCELVLADWSNKTLSRILLWAENNNELASTCVTEAQPWSQAWVMGLSVSAYAWSAVWPWMGLPTCEPNTCRRVHTSQVPSVIGSSLRQRSWCSDPVWP